jgi:hypothetical protein
MSSEQGARVMDIREAIKVLLDEESIGDYIYTVRERAGNDATFTGNSWDHPRVTRYQEALTALREFEKSPKE